MTTAHANGAATTLASDADEMIRYYEAMFAKASPWSQIVLAAFRTLPNGNDVPLYNPAATITITPDGSWRETLRREAERIANTCANHRDVCVFAPPLATFKPKGGAKKAALVDAPALFADCDTFPERGLRIATEILGEPTFVSASGSEWPHPETGELEKKRHVIWVLDEPARTPQELELVDTLIKALAAVTGSDESMTAVHPLRAPGSFNTKKKAAPVMARIVGGDPGRRITLAEAKRRFDAWLAKNPDAARETKARAGGRGATVEDVGQRRHRDHVLMQRIRNGEDLHNSIARLAMRLLAEGSAPKAVARILQSLMLCIPEEQRDGRWTSRYEEIGRAISTASDRIARHKAREAEPVYSWKEPEADQADESPAQKLTATIWPGGFEMDAGGLYLVRVRPNGDTSREWIAQAFDVTATATDENGGDMSAVIAFRNGLGHHKELVVNAAERHAEKRSVLARLASAGLVFKSTQAEHVLDAILQARTVRRETTVKAPGWTRDGRTYVLPDGDVIAPPDAEATAYRLDDAYIDLHGRGRKKGTIEGSRRVAELMKGNTRGLFVLSAAFAPPLMRELNAETRIVHFFDASSRGKTTLLETGASMWGDPSPLPSWNATQNGLEAQLAAGRDALTVLDEAHQANPKILSQVIYQVANETGRTRMAQNTRGMREVNRWKGIVLSSGETRLATLVKYGQGKNAEGKITAGLELRALDIPALAGDGARGVFDTLHHHEPKKGDTTRDLKAAGARFADELRQLTRGNYGHLGPLFLRELVKNHAAHVEKARERIDKFRTDHVAIYADGQVRRTALAFATIGAAGELANDLCGLGWKQGEAMDAAAEMFRVWREANGGDVQREGLEALRRVRDFIDEHGGAFDNPDLDQKDKETGKVLRPYTPRNVPGGGTAGWLHHRKYVFNPATWSRLFPDIGPEAAAKALAEDLVVVSNTGEGRVQYQCKIRGERRKGYAVDPDQLAAAIEEAENPKPKKKGDQ